MYSYRNFKSQENDTHVITSYKCDSLLVKLVGLSAVISRAAWVVSICVVSFHQCGISKLVAQVSFLGETRGGAAKMSSVSSGYHLHVPELYNFAF